MFLLYEEELDSTDDPSQFQIRMVLSALHVINDPAGRLDAWSLGTAGHV